MTLLNAVLLLSGAVFALLLACAVCVWIEKKSDARAEKTQDESARYDERQIAAQGKAAKVCSMTFAVYYGCLALYLMPFKNQQYPVDPFILVWAGLVVGSLVYTAYCMMTDAVLPLSKNRAASGIGLFTSGVLMFVAVAVGHDEQDMPVMVNSAFDWFCLIGGVSSIANGIIYWLAHFRDKRADP